MTGQQLAFSRVENPFAIPADTERAAKVVPTFWIPRRRERPYQLKFHSVLVKAGAAVYFPPEASITI